MYSVNKYVKYLGLRAQYFKTRLYILLLQLVCAIIETKYYWFCQIYEDCRGRNLPAVDQCTIIVCNLVR